MTENFVLQKSCQETCLCWTLLCYKYNIVFEKFNKYINLLPIVAVVTVVTVMTVITVVTEVTDVIVVTVVKVWTENFVLQKSCQETFLWWSFIVL